MVLLGPLFSRSEELVTVAAAALVFAVALFTPAVLGSSDTYWHISAGRWMLDNHAILRIDPFSYTFIGMPWHSNEWFAEVVMALAFVGAGWKGVVTLSSAAAALTAYLLARHLSRGLRGAVFIAALAAVLFCASGAMLARPQLLALPLLEVWTAELVFARRESRRPSWMILPVMLLWANLHASFLVGIGIALAFAVEAAMRRSEHRDRLTREWMLFAAASVVVAMLTPYGIEGFVFPFRAMPMLVEQGDWAPAAAIVTALVLSEPLGRILRQRSADIRADLPLKPLAVLGAAMLLILGVRFFEPLKRGDDPHSPASALTHVPLALQRAPVLNDTQFGGYLIFRDVRPFVDTRTGLYSPYFLRRYQRIMRPDTPLLKTALTKYHIRWTILAPGSAAARAMDRVAGWHRIYADPWAVVHVRESP